MRLTAKNTLLAGALSAFGFTAILSAPVLAGVDDVVVEGAWSRASIGTNRPGVAYMTIRNTGNEAVTLMSIRTDLAMMPEIHQTSTNAEGVSSMAPAGELEIASGGSVALEPGGLHAMLMRLQRPMTEGESFTLTLIFADGAEKTVNVPIFGIAARGPEN
ncbi:copper chaperone PCu(A)C [Ruegeria arenilitoris]|uniref:copper chaperone PCu(A)C n=1 Tax=Ruegeria arenilitoris TaxID=1173585 RepID=UPI00147CEC9A|nr:copper chaperone PCu(A)C [Ruegeria arenilitoris]